MPPAKNRVAQDDSSNSSKQAPAATLLNGKGKKPILQSQQPARAAKEKDLNAMEDANPQNGQTANTGLSWASEDLALLENYRAAHKIDTQPAFSSFRNWSLLNAPGIAKHSPTMARKREQKKVSKDHLAMAVRKHFNNTAVNEVNVMVDLLYKVRNQDKAFRMRSNPAKAK